MSDGLFSLGKTVENAFSWEFVNSGATTFLDIFGLQDSASIEPHDIPTEFSRLLDASGSLLDTEDMNSFLEPSFNAGAPSLPHHDVLCLSSKAIDEPINHVETTYETFWTLPSLPQTRDQEKVAVDARFDDQISDVWGLNQGVEKPLWTTSQGHFATGNHRTSTAGFDNISLDVLGPIPVNDRPSRWSPSDIVLTSQLWKCLVCGMRFKTYGQLIAHASTKTHATLKCHVQPCGYVFVHKDQTYRNHLRTSHPNVYECQECTVSFISQSLLEDHARRSGHACFICDNQACENTFSRLDTYQRHQNKHRDDAIRFPCPHCKKYGGLNGFKRKDHLTQHLQGFHRMEEDNAQSQGGYSCPHDDCLDYRNGSQNGNHKKDHAFGRRSGYIHHMKTAHNESEFPCLSPACDRVGGKGYFRKADLRAHMKKVHGNDHVVIGITNA